MHMCACVCVRACACMGVFGIKLCTVFINIPLVISFTYYICLNVNICSVKVFKSNKLMLLKTV